VQLGLEIAALEEALHDLEVGEAYSEALAAVHLVYLAQGRASFVEVD